MTLQAQAEQTARHEYCPDCKGFDGHECIGNVLCDGFKVTVEAILKEWAEEDAARENAK